ncbi:short-chain dehydrogenase [Ensifer sp. NM-2]|uniref:SDR family NAD(P)-dependent oxidoreductase n=1 Tax=Ensifer sp. NM-2 TaxID=2109730 RepID=UPI000D13933E|nr:SDR family NAD(P)-dependent oxidoreductase [Ensifer sp. NM-2]PSS60533.1 short-chain dehydrogenase [Ensifer sp. NM-2]
MGLPLENKRAVVTGAGSGLGKAIAIALSRAGADVAVQDLNPDGADATTKELLAEGARAFSLSGSVANATDVARIFSEIDQRWSGIDILVNNAGINMNKPTLELDPEEWRRAMTVNLDGTFYCAREAAFRMKVRASGSIVNISSIYGLVAAPNRAAYCASKAGVAMLTKSLAVEWAELGIRVNAVSPGYSLTPAVHALAEQGRLDIDALTRRTPQKRLAEPAEIADAVLYLCEQRSQHITGQVLAVDGGWTAYGYI